MLVLRHELGILRATAHVCRLRWSTALPRGGEWCFRDFVDRRMSGRPGASKRMTDRFFALSELLERCLGRPVELVTTEALSPFIGPRILAEAEDVLRVA